MYNHHTYYDEFQCSPAQYHGVVDRLWKVLGKLDTGVQNKDVFTQCVERIKELEKENQQLREEIAIDDKPNRLLIRCEEKIGELEEKVERLNQDREKLLIMIKEAQKALTFQF